MKTGIAEEISIRIMDAFVRMRHYLGNNELRLSNTANISNNNNLSTAGICSLANSNSENYFINLYNLGNVSNSRVYSCGIVCTYNNNSNNTI